MIIEVSNHRYRRNPPKQWKTGEITARSAVTVLSDWMMDILKDRNMLMICDAGCSVLGMTPPYELGVASYGMGASIAVAARSTNFALIGDYALLHSGLNALVDVYEKHLPLLCIIMKNNCTAMTGKQPAYDPVPFLSSANSAICRADDRKTLENEPGHR